MRLLLVIFASIFFCGTVCCQIVSNEEMITRIIDSGTIEGQMSKHIGVMGDAAAVLVAKVLAGRNLRASDIDGALSVLNMAFADPSMVEIASDRKPRAALFVLQAFDHSLQDAALKKRIAETRA